MGNYLAIFNYYGDPLLEFYAWIVFAPPLLIWIFVSEYMTASLLINTESEQGKNYNPTCTILLVNGVALVVGFTLSKLLAYQPTFEEAIKGTTIFDDNQELSQWRHHLGYLMNYCLCVLNEGILLRLVYGLGRGVFVVSPYIVALLCNTVSFIGFFVLSRPLAYLWNLLL